MLDSCCEGGWTKRKSDHYWIVTKASCGTIYRSLPLGAHGKRKANVTDVEAGQVRTMARVFGILECAKREIAGL